MPQLVLAPGNAISYDLIEPDTGGVTFVFFNALSGDKDMWITAVGEAVRKAGHGMLLYNLRGQAGSPTTQATIDVGEITKDALALLTHVSPVRPVYVGLSIGGLFALQAHLAGGAGRAEGIVLINTLRQDGPRLGWINEAVVRAVETGGFELMKDLYMPLLMNSEWQAANRAHFLSNNDYAPSASDDTGLMLLKSGSTANWDLPYEAVAVPVLSITGLQDRVFYNASDVENLAARMPQCERLDLANAGHMVPVERPQELADALVQFAAKLE